jgi:hypothetical protein
MKNAFFGTPMSSQHASKSHTPRPKRQPDLHLPDPLPRSRPRSAVEALPVLLDIWKNNQDGKMTILSDVQAEALGKRHLAPELVEQVHDIEMLMHPERIKVAGEAELTALEAASPRAHTHSGDASAVLSTRASVRSRMHSRSFMADPSQLSQGGWVSQGGGTPSRESYKNVALPRHSKRDSRGGGAVGVTSASIVPSSEWAWTRHNGHVREDLTHALLTGRGSAEGSDSHHILALSGLQGYERAVAVASQTNTARRPTLNAAPLSVGADVLTEENAKRLARYSVSSEFLESFLQSGAKVEEETTPRDEVARKRREIFRYVLCVCVFVCAFVCVCVCDVSEM